MTEKVHLSWDRIVRDAHALAHLCALRRKWSAVIAVTRGGLIPAALLAEKMSIRVVDTICIQNYDLLDRRLTESIVLKDIHNGWGKSLGFGDLLVVDDLVDSGETAKMIKNHLPGVHFACLYAKPTGKPYADTYVWEYKQEEWIVFPWEV